MARGSHDEHNLSPDGGDKPTGELAAAIDDQFGYSGAA